MALVNIVPNNIPEQKQLFFESECRYNPQFEYDNLEAAQKFMVNQKAQAPNEALFELAEKIMQSFLETHGSESTYLESEGDLVSQEETEKIFQDYINQLEFQDQLTINF